MPRLIAIDLGAHTVKVSTYRVQGRKVQFEERLQMRVPQDGVPPALDTRLAALDALLGDHPELVPSGSDKVALAMPGEHATLHRVELPFHDKAQIEKTLPFVVEGQVPFDLEDMVLGWRRLGRGPKTTEVLALLVDHDELKRWIDATAARRLDPAEVYVDVELLGHYGVRAGEPGPAEEGDEAEEMPAVTTGQREAIAVVDVGHLRTLVTVVADGTVVHARAIDVGGHTFTRSIQSALNCSWAQAEAWKHGEPLPPDPEVPSKGEAPTDPGEEVDATEAPEVPSIQPEPRFEPEPVPTRQEPVFEAHAGGGYAQLPPEARAAVDAAMGLLLAEVRSTLIEAEDRLALGIEEIRLTGGGARLKELAGFLVDDLGVPVAPCADPDGEVVPVGFHVSHALAMQAVDQARTSAIDLRIGDLEFRGGTDLLRAALLYGTLGLGVFAVAALVMFAVQFRSLAVEQRDTEARIHDLIAETFPEVPRGSISSIEGAAALARQMRDDAAHRAQILARGGAGIPPTIDLLATLTQAFPPHPGTKVEVERLTITPAQISFDAETDGYASSAQVEAQLQSHPRFQSATKGQETRLGNGRVKFPITIPLGDAEEEG